jgi:putative transposase
VRKLKIGRSAQMDALARAAGELYSTMVVRFWRTVRHKGLWLKARHMMRWLTSPLLHAHTSDAIVQAFFAALDSWRARRRDDPDADPPHRRPRFYRVIWKCTAITLRDGLLRLSNGKGNAPLLIPWPFGAPVQVEMGWDGTQYELRATYVVVPAEPLDTGGVTGVDLGEVHLAVAHDGARTTIVNGAHVRALRRYQNKTKGALAARIDSKQKGSRRRRKLVRSKRKQLRRLDHQLRDALHKQTTHLVSTLHASGVQTVVIGDIRDIRQHTDHGRHGNQRVHQMPSGQVRHMLTYKAERLGMQVVVVGERYTTQTCPACGQRYKPSGRMYRCRQCGFVFHRDGVGAINIRRTYTGSGLVVGAMASPTGVRYHAHLSRSSGSNGRERIPAL